MCAQHAFVLAWEFGSAHEFKSRFSGSNFLSAQSRSTLGGLGASSWPPCARYKFYAGEGPGWVGWFCSIFAKIELYIHHALVCRPCIDGRYRAYLSIGVLEGRPWPGNLSCRPFSFSKERDCCCRPGYLTRKHRFFYEYESRRAVGRRPPSHNPPGFFSTRFPGVCTSSWGRGRPTGSVKVILFLHYVQSKQ